jgi:predicted Zn-dependent protease
MLDAMEWSRRDWLRGVAGGVAAGVALGFGCGAPVVRRPDRGGWLDEDEVRTWLRVGAARLAGVFREVSAGATLTTTTTAAADLDGRGVQRGQRGTAYFGGEDERGRRHEWTTDLSATAISALLARIAPGASRELDLGRPENFVGPGATPGHLPGTDAWSAVAEELLARVQRRPSSRVIHAAAMVTSDHLVTWHISDGRDLRQHLVHTRLGVVLMSRNATGLQRGEFLRGVVAGPSVTALTEEDLDGALVAALERKTPGGIDGHEATVALSPAALARVLRGAVAPMLVLHSRAGAHGARWPALPLHLHLSNFPSSEIHGGYFFDDRGDRVVEIPLISDGVIADPDHRGNWLRPALDRPAESVASALRCAPGGIQPAELATAVGDGWIIDDPGALGLDADSGRFSLRSDAARRVKAGALTGQVFDRVELSASVSELLSACSGLSSEPALAVLAAPDRRSSSVLCPAMVTRGWLGSASVS